MVQEHDCAAGALLQVHQLRKQPAHFEHVGNVVRCFAQHPVKAIQKNDFQAVLSDLLFNCRDVGIEVKLRHLERKEQSVDVAGGSTQTNCHPPQGVLKCSRTAFAREETDPPALCHLEDFEEQLLRASLYRVSLALSLLVRRVHPEFFALDRALIRQLAVVCTQKEFRAEVEDFRRELRRKRKWFKNALRLRISGQRLLRFAFLLPK
jgi:hypothetical protein